MAETIEAVIRELNAKIVSERGLKLAMEPKVTIPNEERGRERHRRTSPTSPTRSRSRYCPRSSWRISRASSSSGWSRRSPTREINEALDKIAEQNRPYAAKGEGAKVENGDRVVIDFTGRIDGEPFEGGTGGDVGVNIGSGTFIPGFEDQLVGMAAGEKPAW